MNNKKGRSVTDRPRESLVQMGMVWSLRRFHTSSRLPTGRQSVPVVALRWLLMDIFDVPTLEALPILAVHVLRAVHVTLASRAFLELDHLTNSIHTFFLITG